MSLSKKERIDILIALYCQGVEIKSFKEVVYLFNDKHSDHPLIAKSTNFKTVIWCRDLDFVKNRLRLGRLKSAINKNFEVCTSVVETL